MIIDFSDGMAKPYLQKKRYVLFTLYGPDKPLVGASEAWKFFDTRCMAFLGIVGLSRARLKKLDFDEQAKKGIFRVTNSSQKKLCGCIALFGPIQGRQARIRLLKTSGTIKTLREIARVV
ncbi:hypothetical protein FJZ26_03755 [Candidatus Parvarchaeota archaeon]|nr:hypothetical protein [Candidatus Parvarchaeota archaeon]